MTVSVKRRLDWPEKLAIPAFVAAVISFLISGKLFSSSGDHAQQVETVDVITAEFITPDKKYFNKESVNPSALVEIGNNNNPNPFSD